MDKRLFSLEWYFPAFVVEIYKKLNLVTPEPWLIPDEMYQEIREHDDTLFSKIQSFFDLYEQWYNDLSNDEKKEKAISQRREIIDYVQRKYGENR